MARRFGGEERTFSARPDLTFPVPVEGIVVRGDQRGRTLGYPTANIEVPETVIAPEGVFAGRVVRANGTVYRSAISVGRRETFYLDGGPSLVEAYLLDFFGDLYGELLVVELLRELRPQTKFDAVETLIEQIERDVDDVRRLIDLPGGGIERRPILLRASATCSESAPGLGQH